MHRHGPSTLPSRCLLPLLAVGLLLLAISGPASAAKKPKAPSVKLVTKMLEERYAGFAESDVPVIDKLKITVSKPRFAKPRIGTWRDGVPKGVRTWVFPVKIAKATWTTCNEHWTYRNTYTGGKFVVFRDEFGDWVLRGIDAKTTSETLEACPL